MHGCVFGWRYVLEATAMSCRLCERDGEGACSSAAGGGGRHSTAGRWPANHSLLKQSSGDLYVHFRPHERDGEGTCSASE